MDDLVEKIARHIRRAICLNVEADVKASEMLPTELKAIARAILPVVAEHFAGEAEAQGRRCVNACCQQTAMNAAAAIRSAK